MSQRMERAIFAVLERGEQERFVLGAGGSRALQLSLQVILRGPAAELELRRALAIAVGLEKDLGSPSAGAELLRLLGADPVARELMQRKILSASAVDQTRSFQRSEGRQVELRAPVLPTPGKKERDAWPSTPLDLPPTSKEPVEPPTAATSAASKVRIRRRYEV